MSRRIHTGLLKCLAMVALIGCGMLAHAQVIPADSLAGDSLTVVQDTIKKGKGSLKGGPVVVQDSVKKGKGIFKGDKSQPDSLKSVVVRRDAADSAAVDTSRFKRILAKIYPKREHYDPKIAVRRSAILPGWGQMYNRRWWKVPIIYAGFAGFAYFIADNHAGYLEYDRSVKCKGDTANCVNDPHPEYTSIQSVINIREGFRRYRDLNIIFTGLWYVLNVVDAYVDGHLREFNVSDDLSLDVHPSLMIDPFRQRGLQAGMTLTLRLRQ